MRRRLPLLRAQFRVYAPIAGRAFHKQTGLLSLGFVMANRELLLQKPWLPAVGNWTKLATSELKRLYTRPEPRAVTRMISVIVPAHNEEAYLPRTLEALRHQNYGWFEVIVVANGCTDRTAELARANALQALSNAAGDFLLNFKDVRAPGPIVSFRPQMIAVRRVDELRGDPVPVQVDQRQWEEQRGEV